VWERDKDYKLGLLFQEIKNMPQSFFKKKQTKNDKKDLKNK
jgi:hypothetical protein